MAAVYSARRYIHLLKGAPNVILDGSERPKDVFTLAAETVTCGRKEILAERAITAVREHLWPKELTLTAERVDSYSSERSLTASDGLMVTTETGVFVAVIFRPLLRLL